MNSKDTHNAISSPGSGDGPSPSSLPDGLQIDLFGQDLVLANPFRSPGLAEEQRTKGTCGQPLLNLSATVALQRSLESRLRASLDVNGSPEFSLIWTFSDIPLLPPICRLAASAHRTGGKGCSGWPTPQEDNANNAYGHKGTAFQDLPTTAQAWPTPSARDHKDSPGMATEGVNPDGSTRDRLDQLPRVAHHSGILPTQSPAETGKPAGLNPAFPLWLMGYPAEWLCCGARVMQSSPKSRQSASGPFSSPAP